MLLLVHNVLISDYLKDGPKVNNCLYAYLFKIDYRDGGHWCDYR